LKGGSGTGTNKGGGNLELYGGLGTGSGVGGSIVFYSHAAGGSGTGSGTAIERATLDSSGNLAIDGDLTISGGSITNAITFDSGITNAGTISAGAWGGTTIPVNKGGTGIDTTTAKAVVITHDSGGTNALATAAMTTNGQLLIGGGSGPAVATLSEGSNIAISNGDGTISIALRLTAGNGITYPTDTIAVGQGTGITVNTNDVAVSASQTSITSIINSSLGKIGTAADQEYITFGTSNEVNTFINGAEKLSVTASGVVITGTLTATDDITAYYSDERLKDFQGTIPDALDKVNQLNGYYFVENKEAKKLGYNNPNRQVGVSAQEIRDVLPEVTKSAPINDVHGTDYLTVQYEKVVPLLIESIKELSEKVKKLEDNYSGPD
jgi:hypothetical protein